MVSVLPERTPRTKEGLHSMHYLGDEAVAKDVSPVSDPGRDRFA